ncbi:MAG: hypothetical protein JNL76_05450 [Alphaproteobacteria bacterium]|nr:hypothetical protein [Alphaproteobacteria bacterium]
MSKMIMTEANGVTFYVDTQHKHSIDYISDKPYYEYAFTPYAVFDNTLYNQHSKHASQSGQNEKGGNHE